MVAGFKNDRSAEVPDASLDRWSGPRLTDGSEAVNPVAIRDDITRAGCWAHARRKFHDALLAGRRKAGAVLRPIQRLFGIERAVLDRAKRRNLDLRQLAGLRVDVRGRLLRRVLREVFARYEDPSTPTTEMLHKAVRYVVRQRSPLPVHLDNGRVPIHNSDAERNRWHVVIGRKDWLNFASARGGQVAGGLCSLVSSCKPARINVEAYLEDVLTMASTAWSSRVAELKPWGWAEACAPSCRTARPDAAIRRGRLNPASADTC